MKLALWLWPHEAWRWQERPHWGGARAGLLTHSPFPPAATSHPLCAEPQLHAFSERLLCAGQTFLHTTHSVQGPEHRGFITTLVLEGLMTFRLGVGREKDSGLTLRPLLVLQICRATGT